MENKTTWSSITMQHYMKGCQNARCNTKYIKKVFRETIVILKGFQKAKILKENLNLQCSGKNKESWVLSTLNRSNPQISLLILSSNATHFLIHYCCYENLVLDQYNNQLISLSILTTACWIMHKYMGASIRREASYFWAGIGVPPPGSKTAVRQKVNYPK